MGALAKSWTLSPDSWSWRSSFNEAEALTETLYVVEPAEEDVIQVTRRKKKGKREANLKELPVEVISHTPSGRKAAGDFWLRWLEAAPR